jgi:putative monooxygenase
MSVQQRARLRHESEIASLPLEGGTLQWTVDRDLGAQHVMAYRLVLEPDSALSHVHSRAEEALYVLEGTGEVRVEGATHQVGGGQAVFIPDGAEHTYLNTGATPLIIVGAMAPPVDLGDIRPAMPRLDLSGLKSSSLDERGVAPTMMDEREVTPTLMGERSFRVLVSPEVGCSQMTQFTGVIPTGRAPLHAHPHEEAVYILAGTGRLWIEDAPVGELCAGSVVFFPIGVRHTLENTGQEDMKVLGAFSPAGSPEAKLPSAGWTGYIPR